ncbi:MAG: non-homologous end-joining DNA ligase LigD [Candidatus Thorarchaeota archaeon]
MILHTDLLFYSFFPREIGIPSNSYFQRRTCTTSEFFEEIDQARWSNKQIYAGVYALDNGKVVIDRIAFDIDAPSLFTAKKVALKLCSILNNLDLQPVIVFSGRRGFHVYAFLSPKQMNIAFAKCITRLLCLELTKELPAKKFVDTHLFGNVRGMLRVPNTLHSSKHYAIPLMQEKFMEQDIMDILRMSRLVQEIDEIERDYRTVIDIADEIQVSGRTQQHNSFSVHHNTDKIGVIGLDVIREFVRECVVDELLTNSEPHHLVRFDFVSELMCAGFSEEDVLRIFTRYFSFWNDFDVERTRYQIHHIFQHKYLPLSCSKLREYVRCRKGSCGWWYLWR